MSEKTALTGIRRAARERERATKARQKATDDLRRYVREAQEAGVSITQIAREAGLSRQGVYDLLGQSPSQRS